MMKMAKLIVRSRSFGMAVLIGILGGVSFWLPWLGIPIAVLTILGAWMQGYENEESAKRIQINFLLQEKHQLIAWDFLNEHTPWELSDSKKRQAEIDKELANLMGS